MAGLGRRKWNSVPTTRKHAFRDDCRRAGLGCHICGKPIDYTVDPAESDGFSIDHFRPKHLYPKLVGDVSNWRAAHRGCNELAGRAFNEVRRLRYKPFERLGL